MLLQNLGKPLFLLRKHTAIKYLSSLHYLYLRNVNSNATVSTTSAAASPPVITSTNTPTSTSITISAGSNKPNSKIENFDSNFRETIAPWVQIGQFNPKLLSHLSLFEILRSLLVLHICSYDFFVDRSSQLFQLSQKFGPFGKAFLRSTFFEQFVGGENAKEMRKVVGSLQQRGLKVMVVSVLEEDVEDEREDGKIYDNNLNALLDILDLMHSMEKHKPILQLKPSTIMPAKTLENVACSIQNYCHTNNNNNNDTNTKLANLIEQTANGIENPNNFPLRRINKNDTKYYLDGLRRADLLVQKAKEKGVHILVDAEFYSCKPSISMVAQSLMARHNQHNHWIGNTIQGYLKEAVPTIKTEIEILTKNLGVNWFGKVVRGAYLDRERILANKRNLPNPTCESYEETSSSYNKVIEIVLEHLAEQNQQGKDSTSHLVVASHNEISIRLAAQKMKQLKIEPTSNLVSFAQIYGMADYLSTPLVNENYRVYKSTPYGPMRKVFPYLSRRASENRSVIKGAREEKDMLRKELLKRLFWF